MNIQERIGKYLLRRKAPRFSQRGYAGWSAIDTVLVCGLMTDVWDERSWYAVRRKLRDMGKDVDLVVFDEEFKEESTRTTKFNRFGKKALNFFKQPKKELLEKYTRKRYDMILYLAERPSLPVQLIASRAKGKFRAGSFNDPDADLDLILLRTKNMRPKEYLDELIRYLQQINTP